MAPLKFLTPEQKQFWEENGFIKLSNVYSLKELNEIDEAYNDVFERKSREHRDENMEASWKGDDMRKEARNINYVVKSLHNLQMHSAVFTRAIMHPNLLNALEDVMDTKDIMLHHTKAHIKPPEKGAPYLMHQDYHYFPHKNHTMMAVFLHLDDTTPENGGLAVYPGSHKLGPLEDFGQDADGRGERYHWANPKEYPLSKATPVTAKRGDIVIFSYLLLHGSYLNLSDKNRRMFLIQVRAADDEPLEDVHNSPCQGLMLRGTNVKQSGLYTDRYAH